jgi:hypothetical protein
VAPRPPDIYGEYAQAWQVPLDIVRAWVGDYDEVPAGVLDDKLALWYLRGDAYHPWMSWWVIGLDRLSRPFDEGRVKGPGDKLYRQARFEIMCWPLQYPPDVNGRSFYMVGQEYDLWHQFHGVTVEQAKAVVAFHVEAVCAGRTDPTRGWMEQNREILNRVVNDFHQGEFGGPSRPALEVDAYTKRFTGREVTE